MVRLSRECFQLSKPAPLYEILESKEIVERLLKNMFSSELPTDVVVVNGISVLLTILRDRWAPFRNFYGWALIGIVPFFLYFF